jgi:hypothetical protein
LIAAKNVIDTRIENMRRLETTVEVGSKRVRVTGEIA